MSAILEVGSGETSGERVLVRTGERIRIGKNTDISFPDDPFLSDVHFAVSCETQECLLVDFSGRPGTFINREKVTQTVLHTGDEILAGSMVFFVTIEGKQVIPIQNPPESTSEVSDTEHHEEMSTTELCDYLGLDEAATKWAEGNPTANELLTALIEEEEFSSAVKLQAFLLPKTKAIAWACTCVREFIGQMLSESEVKAIEAAMSWAEEPTEANRRLAEAATESTGFDGPASWLALGAFWSDGSLAPSGMKGVTPDPRLTSRILAGALIQVAVMTEPADVSNRYRELLLAAREFVAGDLAET